MAIQDGVDRADRRTVRRGRLLPHLFPNLRRPPARILPFQAHDERFDGERELIGLAERAPAAIRQPVHAAIFVAVVELVARLPRNAELRAQGRHLLALEQAGDKPEPLVHDVTLLPRHRPLLRRGKVSPMCPEYRVTYLSGRTEFIGSIAHAAARTPTTFSLRNVHRRQLHSNAAI